MTITAEDVFEFPCPRKRWKETTVLSEVIAAIQDDLEVQVQVGPPGRRNWVEAAPIQIIEGRPMRIQERAIEAKSAAPFFPTALVCEPTREILIENCGSRFECEVPVRERYDIEWFFWEDARAAGGCIWGEISFRGLGVFPLRRSDD